MMGIVLIAAAAILLIAIIAVNTKALSREKRIKVPDERIEEKGVQPEPENKAEAVSPSPSEMSDAAYRSALSKLNREEPDKIEKNVNMNDDAYRSALKDLNRKKQN